MNLEQTIGGDRAERLRAILLEKLELAYNANCDRFSDDIGDNNVTFGVSVTHNLRHLVAEGLDGELGFRVARPRGSFEVRIDGIVALHLYKAKRGADGPEMIRLDDSETKLDVVSKNPNPEQLALSFEDGADEYRRDGVRQLLVLHIGDHEDGYEIAYIGAPSYSRVNGFRWLWLETLDGTEEIEHIDLAPRVAAAEVIFGDAKVPELEVELRDDALGVRHEVHHQQELE